MLKQRCFHRRFGLVVYSESFDPMDLGSNPTIDGREVLLVAHGTYDAGERDQNSPCL